ncbi:uncharacterized protein PAC_03378 [Phialocephala subalpina]|uniref:Uncharacterized protein n=1 Tax=Phialocephala subalpina TaxID=576137 RepID=A0A1L7WL44_9HELO|nr:uncharacterized protein PAC_03378 [Phialocephala subalpina]
MDRRNMFGIAQNQRNLETASVASGFTFAVIRGVKLAISLGTQVVCAIIISQYSLSQPGDGTTRGAYFQSLHSTLSSIPKATEQLSIPRFILEPSAFTFLSALVIYNAAVLFFDQLKYDHRYQNYFIAVGVSVGILAAALESTSSVSLDPVKRYIPISLTVSLTLSLVFHTVLYRFTANPNMADTDLKS